MCRCHGFRASKRKSKYVDDSEEEDMDIDSDNFHDDNDSWGKMAGPSTSTWRSKGKTSIRMTENADDDFEPEVACAPNSGATQTEEDREPVNESGEEDKKPKRAAASRSRKTSTTAAAKKVPAAAKKATTPKPTAAIKTRAVPVSLPKVVSDNPIPRRALSGDADSLSGPIRRVGLSKRVKVGPLSPVKILNSTIKLN